MRHTKFAIVALVVAVLVMVSAVADEVTVAQAPQAPVQLTAANGAEAGAVDLSWDEFPGVANYTVGWLAVEDFEANRANNEWLKYFAYSNVGEVQAWTVRRLTPGINYWLIACENLNDVEPGAVPQCTGWERLTIAGAACPTAEPQATPAATQSTTSGDYDADNDGLIEIRNLDQLDAVRHDLDGNGDSDHRLYTAAFPQPLAGMGCPSSGCVGYELTRDLDFNLSDADAYWSDSQGWTPIGEPGEGQGFDATFDGNGYTVRNLFINWPATSHVGLFRATTTQSAVRNLSLDSASVTGNAHVGTLVGLNRGSIANVSASGSVSASSSNAGGLTGTNLGAITDSNSSASVSAQGYRAGGLAGATGMVQDGSETVTIANSFATGNVVAQSDQSGGLLGHAVNATITGSFATGAVSGKNRVGGLIGEADGVSVTGTYSSGSATGNYTTYLTRGKRRQSRDGEFVGGLIGHATKTSVTSSYAATVVHGAKQVAALAGSIEEGFIRNSYAAGKTWYPTSSAWDGLNGNGGGLVGAQTQVQASGSYWDTQSTGQSTSAAGIGKTTLELQTPTANTGLYANWNADNWDFGTPRQYPVLTYQILDAASQRP